MAKEKTVSDEAIVAALLSTSTQKEAAAVVGLSDRTLYDRMQDGNFRYLYDNAKADILRAAVGL